MNGLVGTQRGRETDAPLEPVRMSRVGGLAAGVVVRSLELLIAEGGGE